MKRLKLTAITALMIFTLSLSGCANGDNPALSDSSAEFESESVPETSQALVISRANKGKPDGVITKIKGLDGTPIYSSEFSKYIDKEGNSAEYSEGNLGTAVCDGFAFISAPDGLNYNSIDNADIFDSDTLRFSGMSEEKFQDYVRINTGDKVNGLTVISAKSMFRDTEIELPDSAVGKYYAGCECSFLGELELVGYACAIQEDEYGVQAGDIIFVPQGDCPLPVMSFKTDEEIGIFHTYYTGYSNGMAWANKYGQIFLGNTQTTSADVSCLPTDGLFTKVKVVVKGLKMTSSPDWFDIIQADIVTIERQ